MIKGIPEVVVFVLELLRKLLLLVSYNLALLSSVDFRFPVKVKGWVLLTLGRLGIVAGSDLTFLDTRRLYVLDFASLVLPFMVVDVVRPGLDIAKDTFPTFIAPIAD